MPEALLETWQRRGVDDRPGLRPDRGGAERALPAARGRACARRATPGKPYPFVDVRPRSGEGELQVRGPNVFAGYWRNEEATAAAFTDDGWLRTGDIAERDDEGFYRIRGRLKEHVHLGRRERLPGRGRGRARTSIRRVADAAVVGVPDERWGEVGVAFVVLAAAESARTSCASICRARLARFKVPKSFRVRRRAPAQRRWARCRRTSCAAARGGDVTDVVRPAPTAARSRRAARRHARGCSTAAE